MEYHLEYMPPEDLEQVYPRLSQDFPADERKKQPHLRALMESGMEVGWYLVADGHRAGYAFVLRHPAVPFVLLDYLAMERKGGGAGTACLALLKNEYPQGILAEVEALEPELPQPVNDLRRRRIGFYQRAGFVPCPFENTIFRVHYLVHLWCLAPLEHRERQAAQALDTLYALQLPEETYRKNVFIQPPEA